MLHTRSGLLELAPFYVLMSTLPYGDNQLAREEREGVSTNVLETVESQLARVGG